MNGPLSYVVTSGTEDGIDGEAFLRILGKNALVISYDLAAKRTILSLDGCAAEKAKLLTRTIPGLGLAPCKEPEMQNPLALVCHIASDEEEYTDQFRDIFSSADSGTASIAFIPAEEREVLSSKDFLEKRLSDIALRETRSSASGSYRAKSVSIQRDLFLGSDDKTILQEFLASACRAVLRGGLAYKTFFIINRGETSLYEYVRDRFLILNESRHSWTSIGEAVMSLRKQKSLTLDPRHAGRLIVLKGEYRRLTRIQSSYSMQPGEVTIGTFMRDGITPSDLKVMISKSSMNLGFMLSGLPGSGKTSEAKAIIAEMKRSDKNALPEGKTRHIIVTPTSEWASFADDNGMYLIRLLDEAYPINFFRCPDGVPRNKFYENLAMILASASNAGPYQNPMEKCMLNAFRRVYESTSEPEPERVYEEIEESVASFHGKKTHSGTKYTKHGENIRSALENLRAIIARPEYRSAGGLRLEDMLDNGAVFDMSNSSNAGKPYLYALVLNMVYAYSSTLDVYGDNFLRLLISLEEAQIIFGDKRSAAVKDLKQRIQDFRKQGVGLMLITHNADEIDSDIRRLCQIKLYLKQAPDVSLVAARDMGFANASEEDIARRLKLLDSRVGAFSFVSKQGSDKITNESLFIRTVDYPNAI